MLDDHRLKTPPRDGDILIEPDPTQWAAMIEATQRLRLDRIVLAGVDANALRADTRGKIWNASPDTPVIACGHQPAFIHAGVWAKNVAVARTANLLGAIGGDLVVDHDAPESMDLIIPATGANGLTAIHTLPWSDGHAEAAYEGRPVLSAATIENHRRRIAELMGPAFEESAMSTYLDALADACDAPDMVAQHLAGRRRIDEPLGASPQHVRVSAVFGGPFVADLLLNADRFAKAYNEALGKYRSVHNVRGRDRPLPDLGRDGDRIETALWIYQPGQRRQRLWVSREKERLCLYANHTIAGRIGERDLLRVPDAALAMLSPWVVRPRALGLTLWARLLVCDLFVHGIGGAKYDRITDDIFRSYYGCEPPPIACVSATLRLPLPRYPQAEADLRAARHRLRDLRFNPQRYMPGAPADLLDRRRKLIEESATLRTEQAAREDRRRVFLEIRQVNGELMQAQPNVEDRLLADIADFARKAESHRLARGREYFYALHARQRLIGLAESVAEALAIIRRNATPHATTSTTRPTA